jgi:hypothetical protein
MLAMAVSSCLLVGYGSRSARKASLLLMVLPLVMSLSLYLVAEIGSSASRAAEPSRRHRSDQGSLKT